jgi:ABC-type nitrate/sulfonate/bicarbonate transport system ATPase subunit
MQAKVQAPEMEPLSDMGTSVAVSGVERRFRSGRRDTVEALAGVDLHVRGNEVLGVVGPSGCGKSTLLELVAGLQDPDAGSVEVGGRTSAKERRRLCSFMPQRDLLLPWRDAVGNAALGLECQGVARKEARRRAAPLLERFGLGGFEATRPNGLSGGMRQRVAFLRTLLPGRPVLLLDEPFASLDSITRGSMQAWLADTLAAEPCTVLLVTHDVEEALYLSDRVAVLSARPGRVVDELEVPMPRPRDRRAVVTDPEIARLRERAMEALGS